MHNKGNGSNDLKVFWKGWGKGVRGARKGRPFFQKGASFPLPRESFPYAAIPCFAAASTPSSRRWGSWREWTRRPSFHTISTSR